MLLQACEANDQTTCTRVSTALDGSKIHPADSKSSKFA
jgi:hypothetical protein